MTPRQAFDARAKAIPGSDVAPTHFDVKQTKVHSGNVAIKHNSKLHHIGVGRAFDGQRVKVMIADLNIRVITLEGLLIRQLILDPTKDYQPQSG